MKTLPKVITKRRSKRVGRGGGSGKGFHTTGRGQKGQKSRGGVGVMFEGVKVKKSLLRRLPIQRGKDKFKSLGKKPMVINLAALNIIPAGSVVNVESLAKAGIIKLDEGIAFGVKILGNGEIEKKLTIKLPISKSASAKIIKAGGKID